MLCHDYALTISPEIPQHLNSYVNDLAKIKNLMKLYIRREFGENKNHPHLHCILTFEDAIPLQTILPRLKKVFGFIPKKPLVKLQKLESPASIANFMNYIHLDEDSIEDASIGYLDGEVDELVSLGKANRLAANSRTSFTLAALEKSIDWSTKIDRTDVTKKLIEAKRQGYDVTNIITNPRRLALWYHFMVQYHNPKLNNYDDHTWNIFYPNR